MRCPSVCETSGVIADVSANHTKMNVVSRKPYLQPLLMCERKNFKISKRGEGGGNFENSVFWSYEKKFQEKKVIACVV